MIARRSLLAAVLAAPATRPAHAAAPAAPPPLRTPYTDRTSVAFGLTNEGGVRTCPGATGPNCASTSSFTSDLYAAPLLAPGLPPAAAADALVEAAVARYGAVVRDRSDAVAGAPGAVFVALSVPAARGGGRDTIEALLKPADASSSTLLFRAIADPLSISYLPLLQIATSDGGAQRARVRELATALKWRATGCELLECFVD